EKSQKNSKNNFLLRSSYANLPRDNRDTRDICPVCPVWRSGGTGTDGTHPIEGCVRVPPRGRLQTAWAGHCGKAVAAPKNGNIGFIPPGLIDHPYFPERAR